MSAVRNLMDKLYSRSRSLESGFDVRASDRQVYSFIARKGLHAVNGMIRLKNLTFVAPSARLRSKSQLDVGKSVSIGDQVTIDATSVKGIQLGQSVTIDTGAVLRASGVIRNLGRGIVIGDRSSVGAFNFLHGGGGIEIGQDCLIGPGVSIFSENHVTEDTRRPIREQGESRSSVTIGDDVWIGAGVTIVAGVSVGAGAVIGAGAVVTSNVPAYAVFGGVPARQIGIRGADLV